MTDNLTTFQRLVNNDEVPDMINDLENLESLTDKDPDVVQGWELAIGFTAEDVPSMLEELRELTNDEI